MMVTNIVKPLILCNESGDWIGEGEKVLSDEIEKYNQDKRRFLFYPWGCMVCSYARRNLYTGILEFGKDDYLYSDTDSIKCLNLNDHMDYINRYNTWITNRISGVLKSYDLNLNDARPKNNKGVEKPIGVWDIETNENPYTGFKTLGAKRYIVEDRKNIYITIAGVSKLKGNEFMKLSDDPFKMFDESMEVPAEYSGKLVHTYIDDERKGSFIDYQGNVNHYDELSAVHLDMASYNLSITNEYKEYLKEKKKNGN